MKQLLKTNELRQLELIEYLYDRCNWTPLAEIAEALNYSERTLKTDISTLKSSLDSLIIDSSSLGVRLIFKQNSNLKSFYQMIFEQSTTFNLLEYLITRENMNTDDILDALSISLSTLYRLIKEINYVLDKNFHIQINQTDYQLLGTEKDIRYFYYVYFSERYPRLSWGFHTIDEEVLEELLSFFIKELKLPTNYSTYINYKIIVTVNLFRYRQNYTMPIEKDMVNIDLRKSISKLRSIEQALAIKLDKQAVHQLFYNFIHTNYSKDYQTLASKMKTNKSLHFNVSWLDESLEKLSKKHQLPLTNKEEVLVRITNATYCEKFTPQSGYLLYNRINTDVRRFHQNFPSFSNDVVDIITQFRDASDQALTKYTMDYLFFTLYTGWHNLTFELQNKWKKIKVLIISDLSQGHAVIMKNIFEHSFLNQLEIDIYKKTHLSEKDIYNLPYDILIANFPLPQSDDRFNISVENIPTTKDLHAIKKAIDKHSIKHPS